MWLVLLSMGGNLVLLREDTDDAGGHFVVNNCFFVSGYDNNAKFL